MHGLIQKGAGSAFTLLPPLRCPCSSHGTAETEIKSIWRRLQEQKERKRARTVRAGGREPVTLERNSDGGS
jgi:hypothetical protein